MAGLEYVSLCRSILCAVSKVRAPLNPWDWKGTEEPKTKLLEKSHFLLYLFATTTNLKHIVQELFMKTS
jgi:hypothetical protein